MLGASSRPELGEQALVEVRELPVEELLNRMVGFKLRLEFLVTHRQLRMPSIVLSIFLRIILIVLVIITR